MQKGREIGERILDAVKGYVARQVADVAGRFADLESRMNETRARIDERLASVKDGASGKDGIDGKPGLDGRPGADGRNGIDGKDGQNGVNGKDGLDGKPGADGKNGSDGRDGRDGKDGANGKDGRDGERGPQGLKGEDGEPGLDALEISILSSLDESQRYAPGTYARHRGGLWRSFQRTNGLEGWECLIEGIDSISFDFANDRELTARATLSSGRAFTSTASIPMLIDRGVWKAEAYARGDALTWDGSIWVAQRETTAEEKPGSSDAWRLSVKRGRDGRNAKDAPSGPSAPVQYAPKSAK